MSRDRAVRGCWRKALVFVLTFALVFSALPFPLFQNGGQRALAQGQGDQPGEEDVPPPVVASGGGGEEIPPPVVVPPEEGEEEVPPPVPSPSGEQGTLSGADTGDPFEPNDSFNQACPIAVGSHEAFIYPADDYDYYLLQLSDVPQGSFLVITLSDIPPGCDYDMELYDGLRDFLAGSYRGSNLDEKITVEAVPGTYYILVYPYSGHSSQDSYRLEISLVRLSTISGTVTNSQGEPLSGVEVAAYIHRYGGDGGYYYDGWYEWARSTYTDENGNYTITGLEPGTYRVGFFPPASSLFISQYYPDSMTLEDAEDIYLRAEEDLTGIDVALRLGAKDIGKGHRRRRGIDKRLCC